MAAALRQTGAHRIYLLGRRCSVLAEGIQTLETSPHSPSTGPSSDAPGPGGSGFRVLVPIECDVTSPSSISAAAAQIEREKGFIDVLINNAGVIGPVHTDFNDAQTVTELQGVLLKDWDGWAATMATNASSVVGVSAAFLPLLDAANRRRGWEGGSGGRGSARVALRPSTWTMSAWRRSSPSRASAAICAGRRPGWRIMPVRRQRRIKGRC